MEEGGGGKHLARNISEPSLLTNALSLKLSTVLASDLV